MQQFKKTPNIFSRTDILIMHCSIFEFAFDYKCSLQFVENESLQVLMVEFKNTSLLSLSLAATYGLRPLPGYSNKIAFLVCRESQLLDAFWLVGWLAYPSSSL